MFMAGDMWAGESLGRSIVKFTTITAGTLVLASSGMTIAHVGHGHGGGVAQNSLVTRLSHHSATVQAVARVRDDAPSTLRIKMSSRASLAMAASSTPTAATTPVESPVPRRGLATEWGCKAALAYLAAYAAPGFRLECPAYAGGHQAMTCVDDPPWCGTDQKLIAISDPCPAAYMNEASNSWVLTGDSDEKIDPYGFCE